MFCKKSDVNACLNDKMRLSLPIEDETKYRTGLIGILISNIYETENASHANGGPRPVKGNLRVGGLQRLRALKTCSFGVSSHHQCGFI